jgi:DNA repair protein RecO (recombination protein O)
MSEPLSSPAIVLRTVEYSDTSLIVRLFTETFGKVTVIAKGARRPKKSSGALLQPPNHIMAWYYFKNSREVQTLTKVEFVERYLSLNSNLQKSAVALVAVEMLDRAVHDADPHPLLFRLITSTLRHLDNTGADAGIYLHFYQLQLARHLGFGPQLDLCTHCGRKLTEATFDRSTGDLSCTRCRPSGDIRLRPDALAYLHFLDHTHIRQLAEHPTRADIRQEVETYLLDYLFFHVDGMSGLKSIKFWRQVRA